MILVLTFCELFSPFNEGNDTRRRGCYDTGRHGYYDDEGHGCYDSVRHENGCYDSVRDMVAMTV
jgi:hypothetical protein